MVLGSRPWSKLGETSPEWCSRVWTGVALAGDAIAPQKEIFGQAVVEQAKSVC
jgi:hypothetical protein